MGGGGTRVEYKAPKPDKSFEKFLQYQQEKDRAAEDRAAQQRAEEKAAEQARQTAGQAGYGSLKTGIEQQLRQGLLGYEDATSRLRDYATKYNMAPVESDISQLGQVYTQELLPGRRATAVGSAYEEILGRQATEEEKSKALERFQQGYYTSNQELRDSLYKSTEYQDKYNQSYLDNYYDTKFGKQTTDEAGKRTGKRTFTFASNLLPQFKEQEGADLAKRTGIAMPQFGESFTGTSAEIEEQLQNVRDSRQFLYSAGLTNLQGEIDKETQKLKTEGSKELAKIQSQGSIYNTLVGSFNF
jgi:hypothetical protein